MRMELSTTGRYSSGQRVPTVNRAAHAFVGSNPTLPTAPAASEIAASVAGVAQQSRAPACRAGGRGFEPRHRRKRPRRGAARSAAAQGAGADLPASCARREAGGCISRSRRCHMSPWSRGQGRLVLSQEDAGSTPAGDTRRPRRRIKAGAAGRTSAATTRGAGMSAAAAALLVQPVIMLTEFTSWRDLRRSAGGKVL